ncbi:MAG: ubiquinone biosynthesis protein UbiH [Gallionellales bacterium GWA2_60_18]|nr:MAG: ubiquinone biosynthesis protein UbiH [Gallionellales bacterium GWA2_60_18]
MTEQCDIAVIGGGPVGTSLALALRDSGLDIRVLEARPADAPNTDARALALSRGSRLLLDRLGIWNSIKGVSPIRTIHISQRHSFGRAMLRADEMGVPELGYVLSYPALHGALDQTLRRSGCTLHYGASVAQLQGESGQATLRYRVDGAEHALRARLAVVADGGRMLAERYPPEFHDYGQSAVIAHVASTAPQPGLAFERFTAQGPVALLPHGDGYELVWTAPHDKAREMLEWDDARFLRELHGHFGDRVGEFVAAGQRSCFPLGLRRAPQLSPMPHTVLLGNAAQTLHPVAGQGFNMGLRDAWELAQVVLDTGRAALGSTEMLEAYRAARRLDRAAGIRFTDSLVRLFSNDLPLLGTARGAALSALDCLPFAKHFVAKRMMFGANG